MTDPVEEGKAFATMLGKGPAQEPEQHPEHDQAQEPEQVEDGLVTALRQKGKPWAESFARLLHPPGKGES